MTIFFQIPSLSTIYAGRTIYHGYKNAFEDMGHKFIPFTLSDDKNIFDKYKPDLFIAGFSALAFRNINFHTIKRHKSRGMKVFVNIPFWKSPFSMMRINENPGLSENKDYISLIKSGTFGDIYYNVCEIDDPRMDGFQKETGFPFYTIPLAADKHLIFPEYDSKFASDISFIGTNLPGKRKFFKEFVSPLGHKFNLKVYGQDWTFSEQLLGFIQRGGQYLNIPFLRSLQKPKLNLEDERRIYSSSTVSINFHEDYQRDLGGDCNERTFKIPLAAGFEVVDDVACIRKYFKDGEEIIIAKNQADWFEKISYYLKYPQKRLPIIKAGRKKVLAEHTYHQRVKQIITIIKSL